MSGGENVVYCSVSCFSEPDLSGEIFSEFSKEGIEVACLNSDCIILKKKGEKKLLDRKKVEVKKIFFFSLIQNLIFFLL